MKKILAFPNVVLSTLFALSITMRFVSAQPLINIETVRVGDAGNAADTTGYGAVSNVFAMGKYEVTISQYTAFLNSVAQTNTNTYIVNLWDAGMTNDLNTAGISRSGSGTLDNPYSYSVIGSGNRPIAYVSWFAAARFANWMHNGATNGANTETGAYTLNGATNGVSFTKNAGATWWIPSEDEWYKSAYYKGGGTNAGYWLYSTQSDTPPGNAIGGATNQANYRLQNVYAVTQSTNYSSSQNYLTDVGAFSSSASAYGTFDQGGNLQEWTDMVKETSRSLRGASWVNLGNFLPSAGTNSYGPSGAARSFGFRLASTLPAITATPSSLSGFSTTLGTASAEQDFDVSAAGLSGIITITAPTGYEISLALGSGFANSLTLTPSSGAVASTQIFVRLTGVSAGSPAGNVTVASTGAITQNVALSGIVATPTPTPAPSPSDTDADGANDYREVADGTDPNDPNSFNSLSKGLVAYYPFNGNANDESGMGNHASGFNVDYATDPSSDAPRQVVTLGESSYLATALFSGSKPSSGTIVCYLKYYGYSDGYGSSIWNASSICNDFALLFGGSKPVIWAKENDCSSLPEDVGFADVNRSRYESYIVTWSSAGTTAYHNGVFVGQSSNQFRTGSSSPLGIGNSFYQTSASNYFAGSIDEFRVYDRALSDAEIKRLYYLQAFSDFQRAFLAVSPGVMGHFSQSEYNSNRTNGQIDVTSNPSAFNLFTAEQFSANYSNGVSAGISTVLSNPAGYSLYTSNSIMDLAIGALMIQKQGTNATVVFQPQSTTDLATLPFTNNGTPITNTIPMPGNKGFLRVRGVGGSFPGGVGPGGGAGND